MAIVKSTVEYDLLDFYSKLYLKIKDDTKSSFKEIIRAIFLLDNYIKKLDKNQIIDQIENDTYYEIFSNTIELHREHFSFTINEVIDIDIKESLIQLDIYSDKDLDKDKFKLLCIDIHNKWKDEINVFMCSTYGIIVSYLQIIDELPNELSLQDILYCTDRSGEFTDRYSIRNLISHIEQNNMWVDDYINNK